MRPRGPRLRGSVNGRAASAVPSTREAAPTLEAGRDTSVSCPLSRRPAMRGLGAIRARAPHRHRVPPSFAHQAVEKDRPRAARRRGVPFTTRARRASRSGPTGLSASHSAGAEGAARQAVAALGAVGELEALADAGEEDGVVADDVAAAQGEDADLLARCAGRRCPRGRRRALRCERRARAPAATARPSASAVPLGASSFMRWWISTISGSKPAPSARRGALDQR